MNNMMQTQLISQVSSDTLPICNRQMSVESIDKDDLPNNKLPRDAPSKHVPAAFSASAPAETVEYFDIEFDDNCSRRQSMVRSAPVARVRVEATPSDITERTSVTADSLRDMLSLTRKRRSEVFTDAQPPRFPGRRDSASTPSWGGGRHRDSISTPSAHRRDSTATPVVEEDAVAEEQTAEWGRIEVDAQPKIPGRRVTMIAAPETPLDLVTPETSEDHIDSDQPSQTLADPDPQTFPEKTGIKMKLPSLMKTPMKKNHRSRTKSPTIRSPKKITDALKVVSKQSWSIFKNGGTDHRPKCPGRSVDTSGRTVESCRKIKNVFRPTKDNSPKCPGRRAVPTESDNNPVSAPDGTPKKPLRTSSQQKQPRSREISPNPSAGDIPSDRFTKTESPKASAKPKFPWRQESKPTLRLFNEGTPKTTERPKFPWRQESKPVLPMCSDDSNTDHSGSKSLDKHNHSQSSSRCQDAAAIFEDDDENNENETPTTTSPTLISKRNGSSPITMKNNTSLAADINSKYQLWRASVNMSAEESEDTLGDSDEKGHRSLEDLLPANTFSHTISVEFNKTNDNTCNKDISCSERPKRRSSVEKLEQMKKMQSEPDLTKKKGGAARRRPKRGSGNNKKSPLFFQGKKKTFKMVGNLLIPFR